MVVLIIAVGVGVGGGENILQAREQLSLVSSAALGAPLGARPTAAPKRDMQQNLERRATGQSEERCTCDFIRHVIRLFDFAFAGVNFSIRLQPGQVPTSMSGKDE